MNQLNEKITAEYRPNVYLFNPTCEMAVANQSPTYTPPSTLRIFEEELSSLIAILATSEDFVITPNIPCDVYREKMILAGFDLPKYITIEEMVEKVRVVSDLGWIRPWGWSPLVHRTMTPLKANCCEDFKRSAISSWSASHRELYGRQTACELVPEVCSLLDPTICPEEGYLPQFCTSHKEIIDLQSVWPVLVVKSPWSSSGRGLQILRNGEYNQTNKQVIGGFLKSQGGVIVEPWHSKLLDLSFQFEVMIDHEIKYRGKTTFKTDSAGRFIGSEIQSNPRECDKEVSEFVSHWESSLVEALLKVLRASKYATQYCGWFGVDTIVYRDKDQRLRFQPMLEINCRYTMGAIALSLRRHVPPGTNAIFGIDYSPGTGCMEKVRLKEKSHPLTMNGGLIEDGFLALTPIDKSTQFVAWLQVGD